MMSEKRKAESELESDNPVISLQDIIDEDAELETTANAVLGGSNDQDCTYADGYVKRQALYACATCETTSDAGVCLACSLECHDGHELYELYTKRNFRCDCGNSKFPQLSCNLQPNKDSENVDNAYNHNFKGTYCTCKRPYPDPEDDVEDEMIQCVICEDWFHSRHLRGTGVPEDFGYAEMICHLCMSGDAQFLWYYNWEHTPHETSVVDVVANCATCDTDKPKVEETANQKEMLTEDDTVVGEHDLTGSSKQPEVKRTDSPGKVTIKKINAAFDQDDGNNKTHSHGTGLKATHFPVNLTSDTKGEKKPDDVGICKLAHLMKIYEACQFPESASFWPDDWRDKLCACIECKVIMKKIKSLYKSDDTVAEYEKKGAGKYPESSMSSGMRALSGMNRIQQVEVIQGYNDMKTKLSEFLKTFAQESKVVTEEDIRNFFQRMSQNKRLKVEIPHSCK